MPEAMPSLSEADIRALASAQSFERGVSYYHSGAVFNTQKVGNELRGHCRGTDYTPYRISVELGSGGIRAASCTCPYDWGGICKHLIALLLTWVHTPEVFQSVAAVDERLAGKSKAELIALVQEMLKRQPDLERLLDWPLQAEPGSPFDLDAFRRQIDFLLRVDFPDPQELADELAAIAETGDRFAAKGHWIAAGSIYQLILNEIVPPYDELYDEEGDISSVLQQCAVGLERCLTEGTPDAANRSEWFDALLEAEFKDIEMGGVDLAYPAGRVLVEHASDEEWLGIEAQVREKIYAMTGWYSRWGQESLVNLLARRLESTGRAAEISELIFELGSEVQQTFELIKQRRFEQAVGTAREHFTDLPGLVLQVADALMAAGGIDEAVAYVTSLLETRSRTSYLHWLAQQAEHQQKLSNAIQWWLSLFRERPSLETYKKLRAAAQQIEGWAPLRPDLIQKLEANQQWDLLIEIALEEGEVSRALELLPRQRWSRLDLKVARAAETDDPQAAIQIYRRQVDRLIAHRGRENYRQAASILQRVRAIYKRLTNEPDWGAYLTELREQNRRLPALQDELDKAGL